MSLHVARRARPIVDDPGRSVGWWASALGLFALAHLVGGIHVASVYLRAASATWPPLPGPNPGVVESAVAVGAAVLAAVVVTVADRSVRAAKPFGAALFIVAGVLALVAAGFRGSTTIFAAHPIDEHAFWSIRWLVGAMDVVLLLVLALLALVSAVHVARDVFVAGRHAELPVVTLWAWFIAASTTVSFVIMLGLTEWWGVTG